MKLLNIHYKCHYICIILNPNLLIENPLTHQQNKEKINKKHTSISVSKYCMENNLPKPKNVLVKTSIEFGTSWHFGISFSQLVQKYNKHIKIKSIKQKL